MILSSAAKLTQAKTRNIGAAILKSPSYENASFSRASNALLDNFCFHGLLTKFKFAVSLVGIKETVAAGKLRFLAETVAR